MMNKENFWNALAMCETTADRLDLIAARDAEWQARVDRLEAALRTIDRMECEALAESSGVPVDEYLNGYAAEGSISGVARAALEGGQG